MTEVLIISADSETTGNDPRKDEMCQFGSVGLFYDSPSEFHIETLLSTYCKPGIPIQQEAMDIHGISEEMCKWAASPARVLHIFKNMVDGFEQRGLDVIMGVIT